MKTKPISKEAVHAYIDFFRAAAPTPTEAPTMSEVAAVKTQELSPAAADYIGRCRKYDEARDKIGGRLEALAGALTRAACCAASALDELPNELAGLMDEAADRFEEVYETQNHLYTDDMTYAWCELTKDDQAAIECLTRNEKTVHHEVKA